MPDPLRVVEDALLIAFVAVVIVTDWRWQRIPNQLTYPTMLAGLILGLVEGIPGAPFGGGALDHAAGLGLAFLVSYPFYAAGGLKAGDAKMLMAIGAVRGGLFLLTSALYGALAGGVLALVLVGIRRLAPPEGEVSDPFWRLMKSRIPYGVALGIGALIALALAP
jgi:prepilin peptidase CpaA